ncbi:MAG: hypothetical protein HZA46_20630 [Planctomycetales bacterium]|nr:hypothetical protein [Planctomycetales bacterium]
MLHADQSPHACELQSNGLRLSFDYSPGDRWQHGLDVLSDNEWRRLLTSVEGLPDEPHPASPAFQDMRLERIDSHTVEVQLFGQSGQRVYSAAVRFDGLREAIDFDVCCRLPRQQIGPPLVSSYRLSHGQRIESRAEDSELPRLWMPPFPIEIEIPALPNQSPTGWRVETMNTGVSLQLGCFDVTSAVATKSAVTVRWRYVIRFQSRSQAPDIPPSPLA